MSTEFNADDGFDVCDCKFCTAARNEPPANVVGDTSPEADVSDATPPSDDEIDQMLVDVFGDIFKESGFEVVRSALNGPDDHDTVFEVIFSPEDDETKTIVAQYPFGPMRFTEDELRDISASLRFKAIYLLDKASEITDPSRLKDFEALSSDLQAIAIASVLAAIKENLRLRDIYDWIADQYGIAE